MREKKGKPDELEIQETDEFDENNAHNEVEIGCIISIIKD
jgi:hypothetical protein